MQDNLLRVCKCIILSLESKRSLLTPKQAGGIWEEAQPVSSPRRRGNTLSWRSLRLEIDHTLRRSCRPRTTVSSLETPGFDLFHCISGEMQVNIPLLNVVFPWTNTLCVNSRFLMIITKILMQIPCEQHFIELWCEYTLTAGCIY